ncbi:ABC transporter permease [Demequina aurantiaca]|uniref:ABC transporter permease n=1 Tax=Demequina aurantiaca TaxID=676200 RepID=UPI003D32B57C
MTTTSSVVDTTVVPAAHRRVRNVVRLHVANPFSTLILPWLITVAIFGLTMAIQLMVVRAAGGVQNLDADAFQYTGGISWLAVFMMVVAVQAMNLSFRFALGFSSTRRDFYLGSVVYFAMLSVIYAAGVTALAGIERATDGWGIGSAFFAPGGLASESLGTLFLIYVMVLLLFFFLGAAIATVWVRWKAYGMYVFFFGLAVLVVGGLWLLTATGSWGAVYTYMVGHSVLQVVAWTLPVTILCGVVGYLFLRRATPRA